MKITLMHGCGNNYGIIEDLDGELEPHYKRLSQQISRTMGSDGVLFVCKGERTDYRMRIFNPDGSEAEMCGNGIRLFARYLYDKGIVKELEVPIETYDGSIVVLPKLKIENGEVVSVTVDMGKGKLLDRKCIQINDTTFYGDHISVGNPHYVILTDEASKSMAIKYGPLIEMHESFRPERTNVGFAKPWRDKMRLYVWERGAGLTQACGTGACAAVFAGYKRGLNGSDVKVFLPGGALEVSIRDDDNIFLTGPAEYIDEYYIEL